MTLGLKGDSEHSFVIIMANVLVWKWFLNWLGLDFFFGIFVSGGFVYFGQATSRVLRRSPKSKNFRAIEAEVVDGVPVIFRAPTLLTRPISDSS